MKLLDQLLPARNESRFTLEDYVDWVNLAGFGGNPYPIGQPVNLTQPGQRTVPMSREFAAQVAHGYQSNGIVWTCANVRLQVFSQAPFKFQRMRDGRPAGFYGSQALRRLERPWTGGTLMDLLSTMIGHADFAGNAYITTTTDDELTCLRPDWVKVILQETSGRLGPVGERIFGYAYYPDGRFDAEPTTMAASEVAHFAPYRDPAAPWRGMSWLTPVIREVTADKAATTHKQNFFDNAATPNLAVALKETVSPEAFEAFVDKMDSQHKGVKNAGRTLYLGGGADLTVVGADMRQIDFKVVQGAGETRIAAASGVGAIIAQLSEGMQGSSLNAGNYNSSRRRFSDIPMRHAWGSAAGCLAQLVDVPGDSRLWYDGRDVEFLQEDAKDDAEIFAANAQAIRQLIDAGMDPDAAVLAADTHDLTSLVGQHSGLYSVQLQPPTTTLETENDTDVEPTD